MGPCNAARATSISFSSTWQNSWLPHLLQKLRVPCAELSNRVIRSSPAVITNWLKGTAVQVTNAAPCGRRHMLQWQCPQNSVGRSIVNCTSPQKQLPLTCLSVMVNYQVFIPLTILSHRTSRGITSLTTARGKTAYPLLNRKKGTLISFQSLKVHGEEE